MKFSFPPKINFSIATPVAPNRPTRANTPTENAPAKTRTLRASAKHTEMLDAQEEEKDRKKHIKIKPAGIDTMAAHNLFGQLNEFLKSPDVTEEERENAKKLQQNSANVAVKKQ